MQKTGEDKNYVYFMDHFQGTPVQVMQDKKTMEIFFNANDVVKILGLGDNINEFLGTDRGLDFINEFKKSHPGVEVFGDRGMIRKVQNLK
ncbi:hypothetical protein DMB45_05740 [Sanguibacteroides justesenii]|uniref:hypothetical protein n=1 Tax=Sanguibacteroides justesenii TaxID=1547597 RepID=UPI000D9EE48F|nr:hypothetical protein [Sanguibacteroides justesenii]PXZ44163.1 hypothetical protein DMB45_05740 [Sanguibacteroides justesenii]